MKEKGKVKYERPDSKGCFVVESKYNEGEKWSPITKYDSLNEAMGIISITSNKHYYRVRRAA